MVAPREARRRRTPPCALRQWAGLLLRLGAAATAAAGDMPRACPTTLTRGSDGERSSSRFRTRELQAQLTRVAHSRYSDSPAACVRWAGRWSVALRDVTQMLVGFPWQSVGRQART